MGRIELPYTVYDTVALPLSYMGFIKTNLNSTPFSANLKAGASVQLQQINRSKNIADYRAAHEIFAEINISSFAMDAIDPLFEPHSDSTLDIVKHTPRNAIYVITSIVS